jgi:hypothetical protein
MIENFGGALMFTEMRMKDAWQFRRELLHCYRFAKNLKYYVCVLHYGDLLVSRIVAREREWQVLLSFELDFNAMNVHIAIFNAWERTGAFR